MPVWVFILISAVSIEQVIAQSPGNFAVVKPQRTVSKAPAPVKPQAVSPDNATLQKDINVDKNSAAQSIPQSAPQPAPQTAPQPKPGFKAGPFHITFGAPRPGPRQPQTQNNQISAQDLAKVQKILDIINMGQNKGR